MRLCVSWSAWVPAGSAAATGKGAARIWQQASATKIRKHGLKLGRFSEVIGVTKKDAVPD